MGEQLALSLATSDRKLLHARDLLQRLPDQCFDIGARTEVEDIDEVLIGGGGLTEGVELEQPGVGVCLRRTLPRGVVAKVTLVYDKRRLRMAVASQPVSESDRVVRTQEMSCRLGRQLEVKLRGPREILRP